MYKKKIIVDQENEIAKVIKHLENGEAIQVFEKGESVKVILTQEDYLTLLAMRDKDKEQELIPFDKNKLEKDFINRMNSIADALSNHEKNKKQGISEF